MGSTGQAVLCEGKNQIAEFSLLLTALLLTALLLHFSCSRNLQFRRIFLPKNLLAPIIILQVSCFQECLLIPKDQCQETLCFLWFLLNLNFSLESVGSVKMNGPGQLCYCNEDRS